MALDNFAADCQADARSFILIPVVKALENNKDAFRKLRVYPNAIVAHEEQPVALLSSNTNVYFGWQITTELDGIAVKF